MGQRHNRRRTRPRSRNRDNSLPDQQLSDDDFSPAASPTLAPVHAMPLITNPAAPSRHIGVEGWSISQHTVRSRADGVEAEEYRVFGGVPGEDPSLCYNMLEYFGHLDYINT
jgi:hypothetical protein